MVGWILFGTAAVTADLWLRHRARQKAENHTCCGGRIEMTHFQNRGMAFGCGAKYRRLSVFLPCLAWLMMLLSFLWERSLRGPLLLLLMGGGTNLAERLHRGAVTDYIRFPRLPGGAGRLIWNFSDFLLLFGALFSMIRLIKKP